MDLNRPRPSLTGGERKKDKAYFVFKVWHINKEKVQGSSQAIQFSWNGEQIYMLAEKMVICARQSGAGYKSAKTSNWIDLEARE